MDNAALKEKIINVIAQIQADSGFDCPPLTPTTKPVGAVPKFDSKMWPVATTIIADEIGVSIPSSTNIFIDETTKKPRTIDEITAFVSNLASKQQGGEVAA